MFPTPADIGCPYVQTVSIQSGTSGRKWEERRESDPRTPGRDNVWVRISVQLPAVSVTNGLTAFRAGKRLGVDK